MVATNRVREWMSIVAAMVHLALFLAALYSVGMLITGAPFVASFLSALLPAFGACALIFAISTALETLQAAVRRARETAKRPQAQYFLHH
jgi:hypothetical protein